MPVTDIFGHRPKLGDSAAMEQAIDRVLDDTGQALQFVQWPVVNANREAGRESTQRSQCNLELRGLRAWEPGDSYKAINLRATMANPEHDPIVQETFAELPLTDWILVDLKETNSFAGLRESKFWLGARLIATAIRCAECAGDNVGVIAYAGPNAIHQIGPDTPDRVMRAALELALSPPQTQPGDDTGLEAAVSLLPDSGNNVIWISDWLNMLDSERRVLIDLAGRHRVVAAVPQDAREHFLPEPPRWWPFPYPLKVHDLRTHRKVQLWCSKAYRRYYTEQWELHTKRIEDECAALNIRLCVVQTEHGTRRESRRLLADSRDEALALQRQEAIIGFLETLQLP